MTDEPRAETWLERKFAALEALYRRHGRDGLKDQDLGDVRLWLTSKELQLRDMSRNLSEEERQKSRQLEVEIQDVSGYLRGQIEGLSLADLRAPRPDRPRYEHQRQFRQNRDRGIER